jgi:hypothetical protein
MLTAIVLVIFAGIVRKGVAVKPVGNEDAKLNTLDRNPLPVKGFEWLETPTGEWIVAIGVVAIALSLFAFTVQDVSVLLTGDLHRLALLRSAWYLVWAGLATLFSAACVFIRQPALPRLVLALFSVSMASHIFERFVGMPVLQLRLVALCRLIVSLGLVLVYFRHRFDEPETLK